MKVLFFSVLVVAANIFFSAFAVDSSEVLLREPVLVEMADGETIELVFTGKIIFPGENKENILCLCEDENQGYYAKLTPQTKVFISGKLVSSKNLKKKLIALNKVDASMFGVLQEKIIFIHSDSRTDKYYIGYWKVISIAPLNLPNK